MTTNGPASDPGRAVRVWRRNDLVATPWRNGGGATYELAVEPPDAGLEDFAWRISIAAVDEDGPFSRYPGVDRVITLLSGGPMELTVDGAHRALTLLEPYAFPGEASVDCMVGSSSRDLNVMTRRGAVSATVDVVSPGTGVEVEACWRRVLVVLQGDASVGTTQLQAWDGLVDAGSEPLSVRGPGTLAVIRLAITEP